MKTSGPEISDPVTIKVAARLLQVSRQRVGQLVKKRRIAARRDGGGWLLSKRSVLDYRGARTVPDRLALLKRDSTLRDPIPVGAAAALMRVSRQRVHALVRADALRGEHLGAFWFVERADALAHAAGRTPSR